MQFAVSAAGVAIMIGVAALMEWFVAAQGASGGGALGAPTAGKRSREDDRCPSALRHRSDRGCGHWAFTLTAGASARSGSALCPSDSTRSSRITDEDSQGARRRPGGRHRRARRILDLGGRGGRAELRLACASGLGARREIPVCAHQGVNLAVARQTAKAAAERLDREVLPLKPTLVIWETGTMEAVRGTDVDEFRETVQAGIDELRAAGAEVVLMNMQFSRDDRRDDPLRALSRRDARAGGRQRRAAVPPPRHHAPLGRERRAGSEDRRG